MFWKNDEFYYDIFNWEINARGGYGLRSKLYEIYGESRKKDFNKVYVFSEKNHKASSDVDKIFLEGSSNISATGNSKNNTLAGNSGNNKLYGGKGNDHLIGGFCFS